MQDVTRHVDRKPPVDWTGWDCCEYYDKNNVWCNDVVKVNHINPERFKYDQFRYQMYVKPRDHECSAGRQRAITLEHQKGIDGALNRYMPATTDVRALQQTMYIPVVPSNPGGQQKVTFPMTPETMGQPDVTSACCVPVIPSQPGFKNLTSGILPGPCPQLNRIRGAAQPTSGCSAMSQRAGSCAPQTMITPSNVPGGGCLGLPDTFPPTKQQASGNNCSYASQHQRAPMLQAPHYDGAMGCSGLSCQGSADDYDGMQGNRNCLNTMAIRSDQQKMRAINENSESEDQWAARLRSTFGSFGSCIMARPMNKRHLTGPTSTLLEQGNGFHIEQPRHPNRNCYVLERNSWC